MRQVGTMDLLDKIRQKTRQEQENRHPDASQPLKSGLPEFTVPHDTVSNQRLSDAQYPDFIQNVDTVTVQNVSPENTLTLPPAHRIVSRDPLEAILAGREAAGCGKNQLPVSEEAQADTDKDSFREFLCFKVSDEIYGVDIMDIKELIKPREVTEVPRAPSFISGIISLRGVIIPIIDMPCRLGFARVTVTGRERIVVVRQGESFSGLLVDEIIKVARVANDDIEAAPTVLDGKDRIFVTGIGRTDGQMIILLNLANIIDIHVC